VSAPAKALLLVLDGLGVGAMPDAAAYGDAGSNTLAHVAEGAGGLRLPHLASLGLGNILAVRGLEPVTQPRASFGRMAEASAGKDSTTGHWELAGLVTQQPFPTYPSGFPADLIERFQAVTGCRGVLGNKATSGTAIIAEWGETHLRTGFPILYTSADSVFQIAAHEDVLPVARLHELCAQTRREVCVGAHEVSRVIARPFVGRPGAFTRTAHRRDFSVEPRGTTLLDVLAGAGLPVTTIGKVDDLFASRAVGQRMHTANNDEGIAAILHQCAVQRTGLIFANLVDFDTLYGHRNDPVGFARALEAFDQALPALLAGLAPTDLLLITADHGNDPLTPSTDHSREYVPLLGVGEARQPGIDLGTRTSFADVAKTLADFFHLPNTLSGVSFWAQVERKSSR
jgi:phosphopentomutase